MLGLGLALTLGNQITTGTAIPAGAIMDESGTPVTDESSTVITDE
jgi:hypothetical protein